MVASSHVLSDSLSSSCSSLSVSQWCERIGCQWTERYCHSAPGAGRIKQELIFGSISTSQLLGLYNSALWYWAYPCRHIPIFHEVGILSTCQYMLLLLSISTNSEKQGCFWCYTIVGGFNMRTEYIPPQCVITSRIPTLDFIITD